MSAELDVPPAGTACEWCQRFGHFCQAQLYWGDESLGISARICIPCRDGEDCEVVKARQLTEEHALARWDQPAGPVRTVTPVEAKRVAPDVKPGRLMPYDVRPEAIHIKRAEPVKERHPMPAQSPRVVEAEPEEIPELEVEETVMPTGIPIKLSEQQLDALKAASPTESHVSLAEALGLTAKQIRYQRKKLGLEVAIKHGGSKPSTATSKAIAKVMKSVPQTIDITGVSERIHALAAPLATTIEGHVSLSIPHERLDAWWGRLPAEKKLQLALAEVGL